MISRNLLFIVNPNAGKKKSDKLISLIQNNFSKSIPFEIVIWKDRHHFTEITNSLQKGNFTEVIAVGGDGTVNQVAKTLINTNMALGILPAGSGNGLARSLGISVNSKRALQQIARGEIKYIDTGTVNDIPFFCTSGVGFDAHIGNLFASSVKRGLKSYVRIIIKEVFKYSPVLYTINIDGKELKREAFLITVANSGQYGNDFYIAPNALLNDGLFHMVILKPFSILEGCLGFVKVLRKKANHAAIIETYSGKKIVISRSKEGCIHYDGEPILASKELRYNLFPTSLKVIVGPTFNGL